MTAPLTATNTIALSSIEPNPFQPRRSFDPDELRDLAASIKEVGVLQDILVRRKGKGYELIAGERRVRAARLAGLERIPAKVRDLSDVEVSRLALVENVQRADLNPLEEARGIENHVRVAAEHGEQLTYDDVRKMLGKSPGWLEKKRKLLALPDFMQQAVDRNGHVQSSVLEIARLPEGLQDKDGNLVRQALIEEVDNGAGYLSIKAKVDRLVEEVREKEAWRKESQEAPDKETRDAIRKNADDEREKEEALEACVNAARALRAYAPRLNDADFERVVLEVGRDITRGDLSRRL